MGDKWRNPMANSCFGKNMNREDPVFANINLLGSCNVDCYFCLGKDIDDYFKQHDQTNTHYSEWKNFDDFLARCKDANIRNLYITGQNTDALVYKYTGELIDHLQDNHGFHVGIRTNGYLAHRKMDVVNKCRRSVGYSIHSLYPSTNYTIMRRRDIPDWCEIIPNTKNVRVSIVLNRHNESEFDALVEFIASFKNVKYIQVRRICTDTREEYLLPDVEVYERVFKGISESYPLRRRFYSAECFEIHGKEVVFWRTVKTTIDSFNYYTDGTINDEYFVIEGYMRDSSTFPKNNGIPLTVNGLEGYWRNGVKT